MNDTIRSMISKPTARLRFIPREIGGREIRILQQEHSFADGSTAWIDVPFIERPGDEIRDEQGS